MGIHSDGIDTGPNGGAENGIEIGVHTDISSENGTLYA
jgi:hypothetical protein